MIPVIDLFAGPGGLCEGFSRPVGGGHPFRPVLSIEKDETAQRTLELRAFVHWFMFHNDSPPDDYYRYLVGEETKERLFEHHPEAAAYARQTAWKATLGGTEVSEKEFDRRIRRALAGTRDWILIGGPPCQAYSLVGRSRNIGQIKREQNLSFVQAQFEFGSDERQTLYKQYLRILAVHRPAVFVMENVVGILSAKVKGERIFPRILSDLSNPVRAAKEDWPNLKGRESRHYRIFSFVTGKTPDDGADSDFLIRAEKYGVPQARHRVILLGIRDDFAPDLDSVPTLTPKSEASVQMAIGDLPMLRSHISRGAVDSDIDWMRLLSEYAKSSSFGGDEFKDIRTCLTKSEQKRRLWMCSTNTSSPETSSIGARMLADWCIDKKLPEPLNHAPRSHMTSDLKRYLFVSAFGQSRGRSPVLSEFPKDLLPAHANVLRDGHSGDQSFADRFKVQIPNKASSTVTCHISKDGHYFIHYDTSQCRSLTVREAARLQTFPDNYFFEGNQTEQYHQVGNAVPPFLAAQLADIVKSIFDHQSPHGSGKHSKSETSRRTSH